MGGNRVAIALPTSEKASRSLPIGSGMSSRSFNTKSGRNAARSATVAARDSDADAVAAGGAREPAHGGREERQGTAAARAVRAVPPDALRSDGLRMPNFMVVGPTGFGFNVAARPARDWRMVSWLS